MAIPIGTEPLSGPVELAVPLAHSPGLRVHAHVNNLASSLLVFLTSTAADAGSSATSMGSLVYAMPDRYNPSQPMSTVLYHLPSSVDFATRVAKALARRLSRPCYVASSVNLSGSAGGGSTEEEVNAFKAILAVVTESVGGAQASYD